MIQTKAVGGLRIENAGALQNLPNLPGGILEGSKCDTHKGDRESFLVLANITLLENPANCQRKTKGGELRGGENIP